jgi:DNA-binding NarL/FixJ family response regulator
MSAPIRILIVDDHALFREALSLLMENFPELTVIGQASNRAEALEAARAQPDIILLDLDLGAESGLDLLPELLAVARQSRILILTGMIDTELHHRAVRLGAMGLVLKSEVSGTLIKAIIKVQDGEVWLHRSMVASILSELSLPQQNREPDPVARRIASLTEREREVIKLIGEGLKNKQIGERLFISETTVRHYLTSIFGKLQVTDRLELIIYANKHGLVKLPVSSFPHR